MAFTSLRKWTFIASFAIFIVAVFANPKLDFDPKTGRVRASVPNEKPTTSIFWDRVAQDVAAAAAQGPTVSAGLYAVTHTAVFMAWADVNKRVKMLTEFGDEGEEMDGECGLKKFSMSHAALYAIRNTIVSGADAATAAFKMYHEECDLDEDGTSLSKTIGETAAEIAIARYNKNVLAGNLPLHKHSSDIERWRAEHVPIDDMNGPMQSFLTPEWGLRYTYGIKDGSAISILPPVPALLVGEKLDMKSKTVILANGTALPVTKSLIGSVINPEFVSQAKRVLKASENLSEKNKFVAEFWEQGGGTSFPPGAWMSIAQFVSLRNGHTNDEDVGMFLAMGNAVNDAGVSTWYLKKYYDGARPVAAIRDLGYLGLISPSKFYNIHEKKVVTANVTEFVTYQLPTADPSPPFPEYTSGHSTFSSSAAEVLKMWTGSDMLDANVTLPKGASRFEKGLYPTKPIMLHWNTFTQAADEAGVSRVHGGIHFDAGNVRGLTSGREIGRMAFWKAASEWGEVFYNGKQ